MMIYCTIPGTRPHHPALRFRSRRSMPGGPAARLRSLSLTLVITVIASMAALGPPPASAEDEPEGGTELERPVPVRYRSRDGDPLVGRMTAYDGEGFTLRDLELDPKDLAQEESGSGN